MPGGTFNTRNKPRRPGFYVNFEGAALAAVQGGENGVMLVPFTADWGPGSVFQEIRSESDYLNLYSDSDNGTGKFAVLRALRGSGTAELPNGPSRILAYRLLGPTAAKATLALANTTPATMVTLTALYEGTRPARWTVTVQTNLEDTSTKDFILLEDGIEIERFTKLSGTVAQEWVDTLNSENSGSRYVRAAAGTSGVAMANVAGVSFSSTAGNSGLAPTGAEYANFMTAAEGQRFNVLAPANLTDATILAAIVSWAKSRNQRNQRFMLVQGGAAGETLGAADARSLAANDPNIVNLGYTDVYDDDGITTISTAQFVPILAAMIAAAGITRSITQQHFQGYSLKVAPSDQQLDQGYANGTLLLTSDSLGLKVDQDYTSYTSDTELKPRAEFGKIKSVRTHHQIESDLTDDSIRWIGDDSVNVEPIVSGILTEISAYLRVLEESFVIQPGWQLALDPGENNSGNALHLDYGISTVKAIERIFNTIRLV